MEIKPTKIRNWLYLTAIVLSIATVSTECANAECSPVELTAVFVVDDIYPMEPQLTLLDVALVGPDIGPSQSEMITAIEALQPGYSYTSYGEAGPFHFFFDEPMDHGGCAIVDGRDGRVVFAATIIYMGNGSITRPAASSHAWSFLPSELAPLPEDVGLLPALMWSAEHYGEPSAITDTVVDYLRQSDVLLSFGDCDMYSVVSFIYTPTVGMTDPTVAKNVIIVSGRCGWPWNDNLSSAPSVAPGKWLSGAAPNPFNPHTTIVLNIPSKEHIQVTLHDLHGRLVGEIANQEFGAGEHLLVWNGLDDSGRAVASGVYIVKLKATDHEEALRLTLVR